MAPQEDEASGPAPLSCGYQLSFTSDLSLSMNQLVYDGPFTFIVTPLVHPRLRRDAQGGSDQRLWPLTRSDMILESSSWSNCVVGQTSEWIDCDASDIVSRQSSEKALLEELVWATHLSMTAVSIPCPKLSCYNYAGVIGRAISASHQHPSLWVNVPLCTPESLKNPQDESVEPWTAWNRFRTLCDHSSTLAVFLELTVSLPSKAIVERWCGEPVRGVKVPTKCFLSNSKGFPVLSSAHQEALVTMISKGAQLVLSGRPHHELGILPYFQYLQHLVQRIPGKSTKDEFESPFYDYLQSPLQPLGDHLESQMYETFEKDPIKYARYEEAITLALKDTPVSKVSCVMVVGAGRGPLVRCALRAADAAGRRIQMYAVEKNPNAVITLRNMRTMLGWGNTVQIIHTDMRVWNPPELADILVSELLGSWGDNELSPECLDGAERLLKRDGGISIPYEYTSFIEPISTPKLWNDCRAFDDVKHLETMYVVKLHQYSSFAPVKPVFSFAHPSWNKGVDTSTGQECFSTTPTRSEHDTKIDNTRYRTVEFEATQTGLMHGFGGYFEARLYKDVIISINPPTFSTGMFSWFPVYIPLREPVHVRKGDIISSTFWRHCKSTKVWYEWAVTSPEPTPIHNVNGKSQPINLTTD